MDRNYTTQLADKDLYDFLVNAPKKFRDNERIKKFQMKNGDFIHCILKDYNFYISGTDIVKILIYRFQLEGRPITNLKKFEEGVFSDLSNLKPGIDATLEDPRSPFLEFLYKNGCIRTQKKQKVFFWYSVPHDALFCDAADRGMRRESQPHMYYYHNPRNGNNSSIIPNTNEVTKRKVKRNTFDSSHNSFESYKTADLLKNTLFGNFHDQELFTNITDSSRKGMFDSDLSNIISKKKDNFFMNQGESRQQVNNNYFQNPQDSVVLSSNFIRGNNDFQKEKPCVMKGKG